MAAIITTLLKGQKGEKMALRYLKRKGYRLWEKNYRKGHHEIDLIMEDKTGAVVFVEVKARSRTDYGLPREAVTASKQRYLRLAAQYYLTENQLWERFCRFDVIEVYLFDNHIEHIVNAF